ncbi:MAG: RNA 2',3'-cyclic phosphodiesterase [Ruminococcus sp.]|nr:RNA 2',3'-cyclic phosphodiesterase [Ruminococcus sp.]
MPRLFVAINLTKEIADSLYSSARLLKEHSIYANISRKENLHLTLAFIGESNNIRSASDAIKAIDINPFELTFEGYGEFSSRDGSICFAKTINNKDLETLVMSVRKNLTDRGFQIDTKPFKAHITLCRQFTPAPTFTKDIMIKSLTKKSMQINAVSLMRSDRINGKLTYTEVSRKVL